MLCAYGEVVFALSGFIFVVCGVACGGARWALTQKILTMVDDDELPISKPQLLIKMLPATICVMVPFSLLVEGGAVIAHLQTVASPLTHMLIVGAIILITGLLALGCLLVELSIISVSSSLSLSLLAVGEKLLTIAAGCVLYRDSVTWTTMFGFSR